MTINDIDFAFVDDFPSMMPSSSAREKTIIVFADVDVIFLVCRLVFRLLHSTSSITTANSRKKVESLINRLIIGYYIDRRVQQKMYEMIRLASIFGGTTIY